MAAFIVGEARRSGYEEAKFCARDAHEIDHGA